MKYLILFEGFNNNSNITNKMKSIVNNLFKKYRRGALFFDALDDEIKSFKNRDMILELVKGCENEWVASSGEFGDILYNLYLLNKFKCKGLVIFNGKMLTNNTGVNSFKPSNFDLNNKNFIYVDDSYFSGSTVKKIKTYLKSFNSTIKYTNVMYDGSEYKSDNVNSFYRYWDYRDLKKYNLNKK